MIQAKTLFNTCAEKFASYPRAVRVVDCRGILRTMILLLRDRHKVRFFVLSCDSSEGTPFYSLTSWHPDGEIVDIDAATDSVPEDMERAVTSGVPLPRHGSLLGWKHDDAVTALITVSAKYTPEFPEPSWSVMPRADVPEEQWPPFTSERWPGQWLWEHYRAGRVVPAGDLVAGIPGAVFWVDTQAALGWDSCVVARDLGSGGAYVLRCGRYVYYEALREGRVVPPLADLLAGPDKVDLAPRLWRMTDPIC